MTIEKIKNSLESRTDKSAWDKGVTLYALELIEELEEAIEGGYFDEENICNNKLLKLALLNGASDWEQFSWGGCSLIYDYDICERLCPPSMIKAKRNGELKPNQLEEWLDVQARALCQACNRILKCR